MNTIRQNSKYAAGAFYSTIVDAGFFHGNDLVLSDEAEASIRLKWPDFDTPFDPESGGPFQSGTQEPSVKELAVNFAGAMSRWIKAGAPVVSRQVYDARAAVCDRCDYWDGSARMGLGKCNAPGCGCTSMKRWLSTEKCPLNRWSAE